MVGNSGSNTLLAGKAYKSRHLREPEFPQPAKKNLICVVVVSTTRAQRMVGIIVIVSIPKKTLLSNPKSCLFTWSSESSVKLRRDNPITTVKLVIL